MPEFLWFIFDYLNYNELINHKNKILNLLVNDFMYLNLKQYKLVDVINMTSVNYYASLFFNEDLENLGNYINLEKNKI